MTDPPPSDPPARIPLRDYRRLGRSAVAQPEPIREAVGETTNQRTAARQRTARGLRNLASDLPYLDDAQVAERLRKLAEDYEP